MSTEERELRRALGEVAFVSRLNRAERRRRYGSKCTLPALNANRTAIELRLQQLAMPEALPATSLEAPVTLG